MANNDMDEHDRVASLSAWYLNEQLGFDKQLIGFRYETLRPHLKGPDGLELGPAEGQMTRLLLEDFSSLTVVDGASDLLASIPDSESLTKVQSLFEEYQPGRTFDTIVMEHVLEHVERPIELLRRARSWLSPGGRILAGVPNGHSIHRLVAVKMGLLPDSCALNDRDRALGHRRVYTAPALRTDIEAAGLRIIHSGGVFFKPLSNQQIETHWNDEMIRGFYELGKDFPDLAAELYAVCE